MTGYVAHTPPENEPDKWQSMTDHTHNVADMAACFAKPFDAEELARWAGRLHDVGKYSDEFQQYLHDCASGILRRPGSAEHKCAGTRMALDILPPFFKNVVAPCVLGHHGGLNAVGGLKSALEGAPSKSSWATAIERAGQDDPRLRMPPPDRRPQWPGSSAPQKASAMEMLIRFVFSCLVDADSLDTEAHFSPEKTAKRRAETLADVGAAWRETLRAAQEAMPHGGPVNQVRREVYEACLAAAARPPGVFTLTVPTGGGKTRSSLAFALAHAHTHDRARIICAIPYTSIIDQTAGVFRDILGADAVLEHHSAIEPNTADRIAGPEAAQAEDDREQRRRLAAENWDAPLIVTTTVQFFESLFTNRTSRARKLHNIAGSIVILDEVQTLPGFLLAPLLDGLRLLVEQYGVTLILCTATQPALQGKTRTLEGLPPAYPIIPDPDARRHFETLRRVTYRVETGPWDWARVAGEMTRIPTSSLAVVNTKKDALALLAALNDPGAKHLSTLLCGAHRRQVLEEVRDALRREREEQGPPLRLVSTQVVEAGVDLDFPRVLRAKGPLDRVIQAAGRCNREGRRLRAASEVIVFDPSEGHIPPTSEYASATALAWQTLTRPGGCDLDAPETPTAYFAQLYDLLGRRGLDQKQVQDDRRVADFKAVADKVRLIGEDTVSVLVAYDKPVFERLRKTILERRDLKLGMTRDLWRQIQPHTISVYRRDLGGLTHIMEPLLESHGEDYLFACAAEYDPIVGIGHAIARDPADLVV